MSHIIYNGRIESEFEGFDEDALFKMSDGTWWVQSRYKYWYHYAYRPEAKIEERNGATVLTVAGESVPVRQIYNVKESRIDGEFKGWSGDTIYRLRNGEVWRQDCYKYVYKYAYCPPAIIADINGRRMMYVKGTVVPVRRI